MLSSIKKVFIEWQRAIKNYINPIYDTVMYEHDSKIQVTLCITNYTDSIIKFNHDLYKTEFDSLAKQGIFSDQYDIVGPQLKNCVVFLNDGVPFGFAEIEFKDYRNSPDIEAHVNSFYVSPEYRRQGLGTKAFSCIEKLTKYYYDANIITLEVFEHNVIAKEFYMSQGLQPTKVELSRKL
jgi:ribosomal protein S18 acetylase RimI-like enzyme